jgi:hypothetical protein
VETGPSLAVGLRLRLTTADEGGRRSPIGLGMEPIGRFQYRPDWALPHATDDLTAAPVVGFSQSPVEPGDTVRAVIVSLWPQSLPLWQELEVGDVLLMHEGPRVCGHGTVLCTKPVTLPLGADDTSAVETWLRRTEG